MNTLLFKGASAIFDTDVIFDSVQQVSYKDSGSPSPQSSDSTRTINRIYMDRKTAFVTITVADQSQLNNTKLKVGKVGSLVFKGVKRSNGDSLASNELTVTLAEVVILDIDSTITTEGAGLLTISFQAYDSAGDGSYVTFAYT